MARTTKTQVQTTVTAQPNMADMMAMISQLQAQLAEAQKAAAPAKKPELKMPPALTKSLTEWAEAQKVEEHEVKDKKTGLPTWKGRILTIKVGEWNVKLTNGKKI